MTTTAALERYFCCVQISNWTLVRAKQLFHSSRNKKMDITTAYNGLYMLQDGRDDNKSVGMDDSNNNYKIFIRTANLSGTSA